MFRTTSFFATALFFLLLATSLPAQEATPISADTKFVIQLDLAKLQTTDLGGKLVNAAKMLAQKEMGSDGQDILMTVEKAVGFDPLEEIQSITMIGSDYEEPANEFRAIIQLKNTTGNLEGLLLSLPGYNSIELGEHTIHEVDDENEVHVFGAVYELSSGNKQVLIAAKREQVVEMLKRLDGGETASQAIAANMASSTGALAHVELTDFPKDEIEEGPPANIAKLIKTVSLELNENKDDFTLAIALTTEKEKKAEQLQQLFQGAMAMVSLFEDDIKREIGDEKTAAVVLESLNGVTVNRDGTTVNATLSLPSEVILKFLREEADLPL